jgi:hypothetical protein
MSPKPLNILMLKALFNQDNCNQFFEAYEIIHYYFFQIDKKSCYLIKNNIFKKTNDRYVS